ncbi:MAG TPA: TIGR03118 family protein [Bryobacteraceae bacterium]|nr:TIGR03118 family protein [Bryobacteraceae bacterium]
MRKAGFFLLVVAAGAVAQTQKPSFVQHNLVSDVQDLADYTDPALVNPWGICTSATSPFWLADTGTGLSTLYNSLGVPNALRVVVPSASGTTNTGTPTGCVFNGAPAFAVAPGHNASFIFSTIDGAISGWSSVADATHAIIKVDNSAAGAVYFGLAEAMAAAGPQLYAPNFFTGAIDVYDANFDPVALQPGAFGDPNVPAGYAPFNIQNWGGKLYVAYAKQNASKHFATLGAGLGAVAIFDLDGKLLQHLASGGALNAPWGVAIAGPNFGAFSNDVLVGNFGDGAINAYNPTTGAFVGTIQDVSGNPILNVGLWGIQMGNGGNGGDVNALYFAAGIAGEKHGLFGSIQAAPTLTASGVVNDASFQPGIAPNTWVAITGASLSATTRSWRASDFTNGKLPTQLDSVSVMVNGKPAYVEYISPQQINILTPTDTTQGPVQVQTANRGLIGNAVSVQLQQVAPAFFLYDNGKYIVATHADGSIVGPSTVAGASPAKPGEAIVLYGTGFGATNPSVPDGQVVVTQSVLTTLPSITVGGAAAQISFAGLTAPGLYQFNVTVPSSAPNGDVPVVAKSGSASSQSNSMISVQQ